MQLYKLKQMAVLCTQLAKYVWSSEERSELEIRPLRVLCIVNDGGSFTVALGHIDIEQAEKGQGTRKRPRRRHPRKKQSWERGLLKETKDEKVL